MPSADDRVPELPDLPATVETRSEAETEAFGRALAARLGPGDVVALVGPLGAGKTCFARGLAKGLGAREPVTSPTFTLVREYRGRVPVRHVDLYRLEPADLEDLDWRDLFHGRRLAVVEWAEKAVRYLPARHYLVDIRPAPGGDPDRRVLTLSLAGGSEPPRNERPWTEGGRAPGQVRTLPAPPPLPAGGPARVLAIDTSTRSRSLALLSGGRIREVFWGPDEGELLAEDLGPSLRDLLGEANLAAADVELVAVALGPGSFTGVKVGLASAKALAYALGRPLKGVSTLDVLATGALAAPRACDRAAGTRNRAAGSRDHASGTRGHATVLALIDAKRGEVHGAAYHRTPDALPLEAGGAGANGRSGLTGRSYATGPAAEVAEALCRALARELAFRGVRAAVTVRLTGDGADQARADVALAATSVLPAGSEVQAVPADLRHSRAADLALLARERYLAAGADDPFGLAPLYLREPALAPGQAAACPAPPPQAAPHGPAGPGGGRP